MKEMIEMEELRLEDRATDIWKNTDESIQYAIVVMYFTTPDQPPKFVTAGPYKWETVTKRIEDILNSLEQGRYTCVASHFLNPRNVICVKIGKWNPVESYPRKDRSNDFYN